MAVPPADRAGVRLVALEVRPAAPPDASARNHTEPVIVVTSLRFALVVGPGDSEATGSLIPFRRFHHTKYRNHQRGKKTNTRRRGAGELTLREEGLQGWPFMADTVIPYRSHSVGRPASLSRFNGRRRTRTPTALHRSSSKINQSVGHHLDPHAESLLRRSVSKFYSAPEIDASLHS